MQTQDDKFIQLIRQTLDSSLTDLDHSVTKRLDAARHGAVSGDSALVGHRDEFVQAARTRLNASAETLPRDVQQRLDNMRRLAVARKPDAGRLNYWIQALLDRLPTTRLAVPAGAFATAFVLVTGVSIMYLNSDSVDSDTIEAELVLLASADDLELYENLDFYLWLAENGMPN